MATHSSPDTFTHIPVLLHEVVSHLAIQPGDVVIDCTAGRGGHSEALAKCLQGNGTILLCDLDPGNLESASERVKRTCPGVKVLVHRGNFADVPRVASSYGIVANAVLADLGFSSTQMDDASRGFSFMRDGPLDMRLDPTAPLTAAEFIAHASENELARIFDQYGEERKARAVAQKIVATRKAVPIRTTHELVSVVKTVIKATGPINPATRVFQALRIAVNDELGSLDALLAGVVNASAWLRGGSRVGIIAFHSLEDRAVKQAFATLESSGAKITRKPIEPSEQEVARNPRSRSAKLRVATLATPTG